MNFERIALFVPPLQGSIRYVFHFPGRCPGLFYTAPLVLVSEDNITIVVIITYIKKINQFVLEDLPYGTNIGAWLRD